jgi:AcrR family transcriptional regulator
MTMKNNDARSLILEKAYQLILLSGKFTVAELEKATEKNRGVIFYYFKNKEEVFNAVVDELFFPSLSIPTSLIELAYNGHIKEFIKAYKSPEERAIYYIQNEYEIEYPELSCYNFIFLAFLRCNHFQERMAKILSKEFLIWTAAMERTSKEAKINLYNIEDLARMFILSKNTLAFSKIYYSFTHRQIEDIDNLMFTLIADFQTTRNKF